jgi:hypothetical protein
MTEILIAVLPLLALVASLLLGHYPGCEAVLRLSERICRRRRGPGATARSRRPREPRSFAPGGGLLIAFGLAQRPPPLAP